MAAAFVLETGLDPPRDAPEPETASTSVTDRIGEDGGRAPAGRIVNVRGETGACNER